LVEWLAAGVSTFSTARESLHWWRSWVPRYSVSRSVRTRRGGAVLRVKGQDPAVSEIGGHDRRLAIMELGEAGLGIGADEGLPSDPANPFPRADMEGVPRAAKPKTFGFEPALYLFPGNLNSDCRAARTRWKPEPNRRR
jgi:hypothetical protein